MQTNHVLVLDTQKRPQTPIHAAAARRVLDARRAAVYRRQPFTIILKTAGPAPVSVHPLRLKIDPGSKTTGLAVLDGPRVLWAAELTHRGSRITADLASRRACRRGRRYRTTRYRKPRFAHRTRPAGVVTAKPDAPGADDPHVGQPPTTFRAGVLPQCGTRAL